MPKIALLGAGGKMGQRLARNLQGSPFTVSHVEVSEAGRSALQANLGITCVPLDTALSDAEVVVLAVPDRLIGTILHDIVDKLAPGTLEYIPSFHFMELLMDMSLVRDWFMGALTTLMSLAM